MAEDEPSSGKPAGETAVTAPHDADEGSDGSKPENATRSEPTDDRSAKTPSDAPKSSETAKSAETAKPSQTAKPSETERSSDTSKSSAKSAGTAEPQKPSAADAAPVAAKDGKVADKPAGEQSRSGPAAAAAKPVDAKVTAKPSAVSPGSKPAVSAGARTEAAPVRRARPVPPVAAAERPTIRPARVRSTERSAPDIAVRGAAAPESGQAPETIDVAQRAPGAAARSSAGPISGGILCGGGSKWRCNLIEREHDKFYKFAKGHNWTDQTMATDFCATNRQMRVASATRIKSITGGCCGFTVVQVTCRR